MEWRVRPDSEAGVLTQASRSRLEGNARLVGNGGSATYSFRVLGGMDIALRLTVSGEGQVRVRTQAGGLPCPQCGQPARRETDSRGRFAAASSS